MDSSVEDANIINCREDNTIVEEEDTALDVVMTPLNDQKQLALNEVSQSHHRHQQQLNNQNCTIPSSIMTYD